MGGEMDPQAWMFRYVDVESRIPESHPIRKIRPIVDEALTELEPAFADRSNGWRNNRYAQAKPSLQTKATTMESAYSESWFCQKLGRPP